MTDVKLTYIKRYRSRGRWFAYYRRGGQQWKLAGDPGQARAGIACSPEFLAAWQARHAAYERASAEAPRAVALPGTMGALIASYRRSPEWSQLAASSRVDYEKALAPLEARYAAQPVAGMRRHHVIAIRNLYSVRTLMRDKKPALDLAGKPVTVATPRRANKVVAVLSILMTHAIDLGWRTDNPAARPRLLRTGPGYRAWTAEEIATFDAGAPALRAALYLAIGTGQRSGDLVRMTRRDYDGGAFQVTQEKTDIPLWIPVHPICRPAIDAHLKTHSALTLLAKPNGTPWKALEFQTAASVAIRAAGLKGVVWHGLRHTAANFLSEAGCSDREIMAVTGHRTVAMVTHYTRGADQKRRATAAMAKLELRWTRGDGGGDGA